MKMADIPFCKAIKSRKKNINQTRTPFFLVSFVTACAPTKVKIVSYIDKCIELLYHMKYTFEIAFVACNLLLESM